MDFLRKIARLAVTAPEVNTTQNKEHEQKKEPITYTGDSTNEEVIGLDSLDTLDDDLFVAVEEPIATTHEIKHEEHSFNMNTSKFAIEVAGVIKNVLYEEPIAIDWNREQGMFRFRPYALSNADVNKNKKDICQSVKDYFNFNDIEVFKVTISEMPKYFELFIDFNTKAK